MESQVRIGTYKHYKGHICKVFGVARHSETEEELVIYRHPYEGKDQLWARPIAMFLEVVEVDGQKMPRFEYLGE